MKLKNKGALFIEYAMLLAFVVVGALTFLASDSSSSRITGIFNKTSNVLELALENTSDSKEPKYAGLSLSFLESSVFQQMLKNCGTFYPTVAYGSAADIKDLPYATAVAEALAKELNLNTSDFTFTYTQSSGTLMYYAHPGTSLKRGDELQNVVVTKINKNGEVETIFSVNSTFDGWKNPNEYNVDKNGFWNGSKKQPLYTK